MNSLLQYKFLFIVCWDLVFGTLCIFKRTDWTPSWRVRFVFTQGGQLWQSDATYTL